MQQKQKRKWLGTNRMKRDIAGWLMMMPLLIGIAVFVIYPMVQALINSFYKTDGITMQKFFGWKNYRWLMRDDFFWTAMGNTVYMAVLCVITGVSVTFVLATLINSLARGKNLYKGLFFLPNVVSVVAVSVLFTFILSPTEYGMVNALLKKLGIAPVGWFTDPSVARISIVIMNLWKSIGYDTILFLAGLQNVPRDLYEAAEVDGAGTFRKWWNITIPCMKSVFQFVIIMYTISSLKRFSDVYMIGGAAGNPGGSLQTIVLYIYRNAWFSNSVGVASAAAYVLFLLTLVLTAINTKLTGFGKD